MPRRKQSGSSTSTVRRVVVRSAAGVVALLVVWALFAYFVIVHPDVSDPPTRADAVVVLGPSLGSRFEAARRLAVRLHVPTMLVSVGDTPAQIRDPVCTRRQTDVSIRCFIPAPYNTRGEAEEVGTLARRYHWSDVIVVADRPHLSRARLLVRRCLDGTVQIVADGSTLTTSQWVHEILYQTAAYVKAEIIRSC